MIRLALILCCLPLLAGADSLRERLRALVPPPDPYAQEKADDLARIAREPVLFAEGQAIAMFTHPDCGSCGHAEAELQALSKALGVGVQILNTHSPANAALMERLSLDLLPSYVMPDRLIRGQMPSFVLERYLTR